MIARPQEKLTLCLSVALAVCGCASDAEDDGIPLTSVEEWVTQAEYEFGDVF